MTTSVDFVYRIVTQSEWEEIQSMGAIRPNPLDQRSGFMHLSGRDEVLESAQRYFQPETRPLALKIPTKSFAGTLRWEAVEARGGVRFPHLYADEVPLSCIHACVVLLPTKNGGYRWDEEG